MKPILLLLSISLLLASCGKSSGLDRHLNRADKAFTGGDYDTARIEYMNAMRIDNAHPHAVAQLAVIYHDTGSLRQAAPFLARALELSPKNIEVRFRLALLYITGGDRERAIAEIEAILEQQPGHPEVPLLLTDVARVPEHIDSVRQRLAELRATTGQTATLLTAESMLRLRERQINDAEAHAQQAIVLNPQFAPAHIALAVVEINRTNLDVAERHLKTAVELSPIRSERQIRYLQFQRDRGALDQAREGAEALIAKAPDFLPARQFLAQLAFDQQRFEEARERLKGILTRDPSHFDANLLHARLRIARDEPGRAVEELERLATIYPLSFELRHQLAVASLLARDLNKGHANATQALELNPDSTETILLLANLEIARGELGAAIGRLTGLLVQQPGNSRAALTLAQAYHARGRFDDALALYQNHAKAFPNDPQGHYNAGIVLRQLHRFDEARARFERVLTLNPAASAPIQQLVELDLQSGLTDRALTRARSFADSHPESAAARLLLAQVQLSRQNLEAAEGELKAALQLQPDERDAQILLARVYGSQNRQDQALKELRALVQRNPHDTGALVLMGTIQSETGTHDEAVAAYEQALAADPNLLVALNNLAYLYASRPDQTNRAFELASRARTLQPDNPAIADTLAWVHYQRGEYAEALSLLLESAGRLPNVAEVQYHLGATHYMLGHETPARTALEAAVQYSDSFEGRADALRRLRMLQLDLEQTDPQLISTLKASLAEQPNDLFAWLHLATLHERAGARDQAIHAYYQAIEISPRALAPHLHLAQLYATRPLDHDRALTLAKRARDLAPTDPAVARTLGHLVFQAGDHAWALSLLHEAAQRLSDNPHLLYDLAWAQYAVGRVHEAQATMQQALSVSPNFAHAEDARRFVEWIALALNPAELQEQAEIIQETLRIDANYAPALMANALLELQQNNMEAARESAARVVSQFDLFSPAHRTLALLYLMSPPDYQKAFEHGMKARESYPADLEIVRALGIASYHRNDPRRAIDFLAEAVRHQDDDPEILVYLGLAQHQLKRFDDARPNLERAIQINPNITLAAEVGRALGTGE
jgi:tetratricopeptide (TPR) repeat protein